EDLLSLAPWSVRGLELGNKSFELPAGQMFLEANWAVASEAIRGIGGFDCAKGLDPTSAVVKVGEGRDAQDRLRAKGYAGQFCPDASLTHWVPERKCTLEHIGTRIEAGAFDYELASLASGPLDLDRLRLRRRRLIAKRAWNWLKYYTARAQGGPAF